MSQNKNVIKAGHMSCETIKYLHKYKLKNPKT